MATSTDTKAADVSLQTSNGVEKPTHTTSHNQVIVADIPAPAGEVMDNYARIVRERDLSWEDLAAQVEVQDPVLADHLREHGPKHELDNGGSPGIAQPLQERAVNPLSTEAERQAIADGAPIGSTEAKHAAEEPPAADPAKSSTPAK